MSRFLLLLTASQALARRDITLQASAEGFAGYMNCNTYGRLSPEGAEYRIEDDRLLQTVDGIIMTSMACFPSKYMDADRAFLDILGASPHIVIQAETLSLYTDDARSLGFRRQVAEVTP